MSRWYIVRVGNDEFATEARSSDQARAEAESQFPGKRVEVAELPEEQGGRVFPYLVPLEFKP